MATDTLQFLIYDKIPHSLLIKGENQNLPSINGGWGDFGQERINLKRRRRCESVKAWKGGEV